MLDDQSCMKQVVGIPWTRDLSDSRTTADPGDPAGDIFSAPINENDTGCVT